MKAVGIRAPSKINEAAVVELVDGSLKFTTLQYFLRASGGIGIRARLKIVFLTD